MKKLLALICGATVIVAYAQAQTDTTSSTTTSSPATTSMTSTGSTVSNSGTVTDYTPGAAITIDPGTGKPVRFAIGQKLQVLGSDGKVIANTDVRKTPGFTCAWRRKEIVRSWNRSTWRAQVVITKSEPTGRGEEDFVSAHVGLGEVGDR